MAPTSDVALPVCDYSSKIAYLPVFLAEPIIVSLSSGARVLGSMTSMLLPFFSALLQPPGLDEP